jgi:asparagine synthase (glutamine-hydrolysing)
MCGILGFTSGREPIDTLRAIQQRKTLSHRGPDDEGLYRSADGAVILCHQRLSIVDLSPGGHQPMSSTNGKAHIVFNGEIYNFVELREQLRGLGASFHTSSDTEVLLAAYEAWGESCVEHLNGMFAFTLHDTERGLLFGARDRAGEKPFFYRHAERAFAFASELKALLADPSVPRCLDSSALNAYLAYGYVPGDQCLLRGFRKLPAAHAFRYDLQEDILTVWRYWNLPDPPSRSDDFDADAFTDELDALLEDSVRRQLVADVPVGILLSGGIDSSLVTAMAARASTRPVHTFTISFPGNGQYDEGPFARLVASHFGTRHTELAAEPATVDLLPALARQFDEPMADSSMVPTYLVSKLIREHATVALGGDGSDELFAGYPHHRRVIQQERVRRLVPRAIRHAVGAATARAVPVGTRGRNYVLGYTADLDASLARFGIVFDLAARQRLLAPSGFAVTDAPEHRRRVGFVERESPLQRVTCNDFSSYLPDDILVKVDRASMAASLEVRAPWLDYRLIEFAFGRVPEQLRASAREQKILPRRLAGRLLPKSLDLSRKQGFSVPFGAWFNGPWGPFMEDVLRNADRALFDPLEISNLVSAQRRGRAHSDRLFALTLFELWRREYRVSTS